jgi:DNA polymerase-1
MFEPLRSHFQLRPTMSKKEEKTLYLVDGSSYLYRAFFALPPLSNSAGEPTGAIYGVANMLRKLLDDESPEHVAVVFDAKGRTFRDELFAEYKAHRPPMPTDLVAQVQPLKELVVTMGLPLVEIEGVEADDVIGTLARSAAEAGYRVVISTGDKDMAQLVDGQITLINTMTDKVLDRAGVENKFGVTPEQIVDWLALVGDKSDNIPGVPQVGQVRATRFLSEYGTADNLVKHAEEIEGKVGESLRANLDQLELSRKLATIKLDVELPGELDDLVLQQPDQAKLREMLMAFEFASWLKALPADQDSSRAQQTETHYDTVMTEDALAEWLKRLEAAELFAFDTETTSLDYMRAEIVGLSFSVSEAEAAYVPLAHDYPGVPPQLNREATLKKLKPLLEDATRRKVGQHMKYDMNVVARYGIELAGVAHDTMLESYVLNSTERHDMDSMALRHLGVETTHYEDVAGKGAKHIGFAAVTIDQASHYAAEDADVTLRLHNTLWPRLEKTAPLEKLYREIEVPLIHVLSRMERSGVLVDVAMLAAHSREATQRLAAIEEETADIAGRRFNLASPKQLQAILFEELGLPVQHRTPKGQPSTNEDVLQELAEEHPLPRLILEHRTLAKLKSTYIDSLPEQRDRETGRVHTSYHQAVAATGRLSSSDPNLQNIPIRTAEGRRIRQAFIAPAGWKILAADYSQIELRIMAHLSGDEGLRRAFDEGADIHRATASEVFGVPIDDVTGDQRRASKAINFGLIYGMSAFGLAKQLNIGRTEAQEYIDVYFARYPGVMAFMEETRELAHRQGYVETLFGRRLYLNEINSSNHNRRMGAERAAINAPMQGTAADIIKRAMLSVDAWIATENAPCRMIMQVHDELVFEVREDAVGEIAPAVVGHMSTAAELAVPLVVDTGIGDNWDEAH